MLKQQLILISCILSSFFISCEQQPSKISYDRPYDLTRLDFSMDVPTFMSGSILFKEMMMDDENYKDDYSNINLDTKMYHFCYWVDEKVSDTRYEYTDSTGIITIEAKYERKGIYYTQNRHSLSESLATFHTLNFQSLAAVTDLSDQLKAVAVTGNDVDLNNIQEMIEYCDEKYKKIEMKEDYYSWEIDDNTIICMTTENKVNSSFIYSMGEDENIAEIKKRTMDNRPSTDVYLFIFKKDAEKMLGSIHSGVFTEFPYSYF